MFEGRKFSLKGLGSHTKEKGPTIIDHCHKTSTTFVSATKTSTSIVTIITFVTTIHLYCFLFLLLIRLLQSSVNCFHAISLSLQYYYLIQLEYIIAYIIKSLTWIIVHHVNHSSLNSTYVCGSFARVLFSIVSVICANIPDHVICLPIVWATMI